MTFRPATRIMVATPGAGAGKAAEQNVGEILERGGGGRLLATL